LISWCNTYPETRIKLFSDSHQEAVNEGRWHQQMSTQKEVYFQQVVDAVFTHNHDLHIRQLYAQYPSIFIKPIKSHHLRLRKKYNDANKTLGATGAGLTAMELREKPEIKRLLDKILDTFPWWEDLHGFWRTNPSYNTVFSTGDPGQDFVMEAQQFFAGEKSTATTEALPLVGDSWALGDEDTVAKEDEGLECDDESSHVLDMQVLPHPEVAVSPSMNANDNINPVL
ncbi:hypothetical protein PISMIDRAFT_118044, partial [Pisolithus microcarpus 441]